MGFAEARLAPLQCLLDHQPPDVLALTLLFHQRLVGLDDQVPRLLLLVVNRRCRSLAALLLGRMFMSYGYVYVASIAMGANKNQSPKYGNNNGPGQKRSGLFLSIHHINRDMG